MSKFLNKILLYEKEERTKTVWAIILLAIGMGVLYFNPLSFKEGWGWTGILALFISGYLIGSIPNPPQHPKGHWNLDK